MMTMEMKLEKHRILLVEDDVEFAKVVEEYLADNFFDVFNEPRGDQAVERILCEEYDLIILDIMLPGKNGCDVCREVRPHFNGPIVMLTALGENLDEIIGLQIGADDYLAKPVSPSLLLTRIKSLLRLIKRVQKSPVSPSSAIIPEKHTIDAGNIIIDRQKRSATLNGTNLNLTKSEFELLLYMAEHKGEVLERDQIFRDVLGKEYGGLERSVDQRVIRLRKKLGDNGRNPQLIKSIHGIGYLLVDNS